METDGALYFHNNWRFHSIAELRQNTIRTSSLANCFQWKVVTASISHKSTWRPFLFIPLCSCAHSSSSTTFHILPHHISYSSSPDLHSLHNQQFSSPLVNCFKIPCPDSCSLLSTICLQKLATEQSRWNNCFRIGHFGFYSCRKESQQPFWKLYGLSNSQWNLWRDC